MKSYAERKGRSSKKQNQFTKAVNGSTFSMLRHDVANDTRFISLSNSAKVAFLHLLARYDGKNNGDLCAPLNRAKEYFGLSSQGLKNALDELVSFELLQITRQGGKNQCSLYALTCFPLNDVNKAGIFIKATERPSDKWKKSF